MRKYYAFAGITVEIHMAEQLMYENDRHLAAFRVEQPEREAEVFRFELAGQLLPPESDCLANTGAMRVYADGSRYIGSVGRTWSDAYAQVIPQGRLHWVLLRDSQFPGRVGTHTVLNVLGAEHLIARNGGFVFHSSYIEKDGKAILFTAPSGTGKSTQAELWHELRNARIINGDRSAVRVTADGVLACGIPFSGSSVYCENVTLPLAGVVYLKQAPQTSVRRLRGAEAFRRIWEGVSVNTWDREDVAAVSAAVEELLRQVPVFELACTPDETAVTALEGALGI